MKIKYLIPLAAVALLAACTFEKDMPAPQTEAPEANPYRVELSDALKTADKFLAKLDPAATRTPRKVASVKTLKGASTRSGEASNDLFYLVNYADNKGFAVLSADSRLAPIYAVSEEGNITEEDMQANPGLKLFFEKLASVNGDDPDPDPDPEPPTIPDNIVNINFYGPYLSEEVRYWHQGEPFNANCPMLNMKDFYDNIFYNYYQRAYVGCLQITALQMMSAFEWPQTYNGEVINWAEIKTNPEWPQTASLLFELGKADNLDVIYTFSKTQGYPANYFRTFGNFGYDTEGSFQSSSAGNVIMAFFATEKPILCIGSTESYDPFSQTNVNGAHAFLCDGYLAYSEIHYGDVPEEDWGIQTGYVMFHFVWGLGGNSNGYFYWPDGSSSINLKGGAYRDERELAKSLSNTQISNLYWWNGYSPNN